MLYFKNNNRVYIGSSVDVSNRVSNMGCFSFVFKKK